MRTFAHRATRLHTHNAPGVCRSFSWSPLRPCFTPTLSHPPIHSHPPLKPYTHPLKPSLRHTHPRNAHLLTHPHPPPYTYYPPTQLRAGAPTIFHIYPHVYQPYSPTHSVACRSCRQSLWTTSAATRMQRQHWMSTKAPPLTPCESVIKVIFMNSRAGSWMAAGWELGEKRIVTQAEQRAAGDSHS